MVLTRLAKQASVLNAEALNILAQPLLQDHFGKQWLVSMCEIAVLNRADFVVAWQCRTFVVRELGFKTMFTLLNLQFSELSWDEFVS